MIFTDYIDTSMKHLFALHSDLAYFDQNGGLALYSAGRRVSKILMEAG